jgi:hypothetical protein
MPGSTGLLCGHLAIWVWLVLPACCTINFDTVVDVENPGVNIGDIDVQNPGINIGDVTGVGPLGPFPCAALIRAMTARPVDPAGLAAAVLINPVVNEDTAPPLELPELREGIIVGVPGAVAVTDTTGFVVLDESLTGEAVLAFDVGTVSLVLEPNVFLDIVLAHDADDAVRVVETLRYPLEGAVVLEPGEHSGPLEIAENDSVLIGAVSPDGERLSAVQGDLILAGDNILVRNMAVEGNVVVAGNNVSVAYSSMSGAQVHGTNATLLHNHLETPPSVTGEGVEITLLGNTWDADR